MNEKIDFYWVGGPFNNESLAYWSDGGEVEVTRGLPGQGQRSGTYKRTVVPVKFKNGVTKDIPVMRANSVMQDEWERRVASIQSSASQIDG
ncbi:hypothetical protein A7J67_08370 [Achromobacter xylosoxidans]|nr:hypothetical protein A7J67_08370 [Achromobacter xylosoxidans]